MSGARIVYPLVLRPGVTAYLDVPEDGITPGDAERLCDFVAALVMGLPPTGAERYLDERLSGPAFEREAADRIEELEGALRGEQADAYHRGFTAGLAHRAMGAAAGETKP